MSKQRKENGLYDLVMRHLSWTKRLQEANRRTFEEELEQLLVKHRLDEEEFCEIIRFLQDWQATAEVDANPELSSRLLQS